MTFVAIKIFLSALWANKTARYAILILICFLFLSGLATYTYNKIYNKGYNEAIAESQKEIDKKYSEAVAKINLDNKTQAEKEAIKLKEAIAEKNRLNTNYLKTKKELTDILAKSKSGLNNPVCTSSQEEWDFYINSIKAK